MASLVGSRVERKEDKRFLTGKGRYTSDINIINQTYAVFVRSPLNITKLGFTFIEEIASVILVKVAMVSVCKLESFKAGCER